MERLAFHQRLRLERMKRGWSQDYLALEAGVEPKTAWRWESGQSIPRSQNLRQLCKALNMTPVELGLLDIRSPQSAKSSPSSLLEQALDVIVGAELEQEQNTETQESENSRLPEVQKSRNIDTLSKQKIVRKQHTIYLPLEISRWLKIQAIEEAREISEIVAEALEEYKNLRAK